MDLGPGGIIIFGDARDCPFQNFVENTSCNYTVADNLSKTRRKITLLEANISKTRRKTTLLEANMSKTRRKTTPPKANTSKTHRKTTRLKAKLLNTRREMTLLKANMSETRAFSFFFEGAFKILWKTRRETTLLEPTCRKLYILIGQSPSRPSKTCRKTYISDHESRIYRQLSNTTFKNTS